VARARFTVAALLAVLLCSACPASRAHDATPAKSCASNQDCDNGWACLAGRCADTRKSAVFTHPEQMVTADKVRQEVEHQQEQHMRRMEKDLQGTDLPAAIP
jgi:hypothetical protein